MNLSKILNKYKKERADKDDNFVILISGNNTTMATIVEGESTSLVPALTNAMVQDNDIHTLVKAALAYYDYTISEQVLGKEN